MLGIDIAENSIRVVLVQPRGEAFLVQYCYELGFTDQEATDPEHLGRRLAGHLEERDLLQEKAVVALPHRICLLRHHRHSEGQHRRVQNLGPARPVPDRAHLSTLL